VAALCLSLGAGVFSRSSVSAQTFAASDGRGYQIGMTVEAPVHFHNETDIRDRAPFVFSSARAEVTQLEPIAISNDTPLSASTNRYKVKLKIAVENSWARRLTGLGVFLTNEESTWSAYIEQMNLSIEPFGPFQFERQVILTLENGTTLGTLLVVPASGQTEEGDTWGIPVPAMLRPPPPPPPPPLFPAEGERPPQAIPPPPPAPPRPGSEVVDGVPGGIPGGIPSGVPIGISGGVPTGGPREQILKHPKVEYTQQARKNRTQGTVLLLVNVSKDGTVEEAKIIKGLPDGLNEQALKWAYQVKFNTGNRRWAEIKLIFALSDS